MRFCGERGMLSAESLRMVRNLAATGSAPHSESGYLRCTLVHGHDRLGDPGDRHMTFLRRQVFGSTEVHWWASWYYSGDLSDSAAVFSAPLCTEHSSEDQRTCFSFHGHPGGHVPWEII